MRDTSYEAKRENVTQTLSLFASKFAELASVCKEYQHRFQGIPKAVAFEVQHMCMHITAVFSEYSEQNDIQLRHTRAACGHLDRALLDVYKSLLFRIATTTAQSVDFRRALGHARQQEYDDGIITDYSISLGRYRNICKTYGIITIFPIEYDTPFAPLTSDINTHDIRIFFQKMAIWLKQDLLLSAITPDYKKELVLLRALVELVFNGKGPNGEALLDRMRYLIVLQRCLIVTHTLHIEQGVPLGAFAQQQGKTKQLQAAQNALRQIQASPTNATTFRLDIESFFPVVKKFWEPMKRTS